MAKTDPEEIRNPRRTLKRREAEAEEPAEGSLMKRAQDAAAEAPAPRFGKAYTAAERAEQQRKLQELLRKRK